MSGSSIIVGSTAANQLLPDHLYPQPQTTLAAAVTENDKLEATGTRDADPPYAFLNVSDVRTNLFQLETRNIEDSTQYADRNSSLPPIGPTARHHPRKPSPGLAARLKALGFGGAANRPEPPLSPHAENVGRLPEDQLRLLDERYQANSSSDLVVEKRGRPWKGSGAPLQLLRSKSSRSSLFGKKRGEGANSKKGKEKEREEEEEEAEAEEGSGSHPDMITAQPPEMDTNKYRLPDHTNGNGTKALPGTRHEHLERDSRPEVTAELEKENSD
jgi:hypothetical protein